MQRIKGLKSIRIRKKGKTALPKKKPNLERFYEAPSPFRTTVPFRGYQVIMAPSHGVSGYETTGTVSSFTVQNRTPPISFTDTTNIDPTTNSFTLQPHTTQSTLANASNQFLTPSATSIVNSNQPTYVFNDNYITPTVEEMMEQGMSTQGLIMNRVLQTEGEPMQETYLRRRLFEGYLQNDPVVASLVRDDDHSPMINNAVQHTPNTSYRNGPSTSVVYSTPRSNAQTTGGNGTENQTYNIIQSNNVVTPSGNSGLPDINNEHTPDVTNNSHTSTGTHVQEGGNTAMTTGTSGGSNTPQIAATIVPVNPYPYLSLGKPPEPQVQIQEGTGQLQDVTRSGVPYTSNRQQIQFHL